MQNSKGNCRNSEEEQEAAALKESETEALECVNEQPLKQPEEARQEHKSSLLILDWYEESVEPVTGEPSLFSTEEALAALTISEETSSNTSGSEKKHQKESAVSATGQNVVQPSPPETGSENSCDEGRQTVEDVERLKSGIRAVSLNTTSTAEQVTKEDIERSLWKEEWGLKDSKVFKVSCKTSVTNICEVKDILRLPGLRFIDIEKDAFIAVYRSVEKAHVSIGRLSTSWDLTVIPIMEADEKSQKLYFEKCPPSSRPPKTTAVAERLILRSLGLPASGTSRTSLQR